MKTLAVIIPRFAQDEAIHEITEKCLDLVLEHQDPRFTTTITLVDDGSKIPPIHRNHVKIIEHGRNRGIAVGWNTGWQANPTADFYCWLNADCMVTKGWSFPLVVAAEQLDCISMPYTNNQKPWRIGVVGWCFVASRKIANKIGPFDETFVPAWYEDTDWFHRAIYHHDIPLVNVPISNVIHENRHGGTQHVPHANLLHLANRYRYSWKHGLNPEVPPPFYKHPLPDVEIEDAN